MDVCPSPSVFPPGCTQGVAAGGIPAQGHVMPSSGTPQVQQGNNSAIEQKGSDKSVYDRNVSVNAQSPAKSEDISIHDPEFNPPVKMNKLALAIKIFRKSFKQMGQANNPETDRSASVESIRSKTLTALYTLLHPLSWLISIPTGTALGVGLMLGIVFLGTLNGAALMLMLPGFFVALALMVGVYYAGCRLASAAEGFLTSVVAALADTREKLSEMTGPASAEEKFLNKYRRMEESLYALQMKLFAARSAETEDISDLKMRNEILEMIENQAIADNLPSLDSEQWYDNYQRYCLRDGYERDDLFPAINETKDWLKRASRQKILLEQQQDLDVNTASGKPDTERKEVEGEIPSQWVPV